MCDYTQVSYSCGHIRYIVKAWCVRYQQTHKICPPNVVATYVIAPLRRILLMSDTLADKRPDREAKPNEKCGIVIDALIPSCTAPTLAFHLCHWHLLPAYIETRCHTCSRSQRLHIAWPFQYYADHILIHLSLGDCKKTPAA